MAKCGTITLTQSTIDTDNFDLFADADGFGDPTTVFETGILRDWLRTGFTSNNIPDDATVIRAISDTVVCTNSVDAIIPSTPTPTPTNTPTNTPTETPTGTPASTPTSTPTGTPTATPTATTTSSPTVTPSVTPTTTPSPPAPTSSPTWYYYEAEQYNCPTRTGPEPCDTPPVSSYWIYNASSTLTFGYFYHHSLDGADQMVEITSSSYTQAQYDALPGTNEGFETHFSVGSVTCTCLPYII